jgi:short-subunit dehydrogenase
MVTAAEYGPWAVIPGGSEGVGASFARKLGRAGFNLVLIARKPGPLEETARLVREESGAEVRTLQVDLTAPDMLDQIARATDGLDVGLLIYNAGAAHGAAPFLEQPIELSLRLLQLNPAGQMSLSWHFGRRMVARGRGGIILIGSMAGTAGSGGLVAYCAAKAATHVLAEGLWIELKSKGVDVLCMPLGRTATPALGRTHLNDIPNEPLTMTIAADDIAQQCLDNIKNGPLLFPKHLEETGRRLASLSRREAVEHMDDLIRRLKAGDPSPPPHVAIGEASRA